MTFKIYLTNLGKYNEGELVGKWVDMFDHEEWEKELESIGVEEGTNYEEFFITDTDTDIEGVSDYVDEYMSLDTLDELADRLSDLSEYQLEEELEAILEVYTSDLEKALDLIESCDYCYVSGIMSDEELGEYAVDEGLFEIDIPEALSSYINYEKIGRDLTYDGWCLASKGALQVY